MKVSQSYEEVVLTTPLNLAVSGGWVAPQLAVKVQICGPHHAKKRLHITQTHAQTIYNSIQAKGSNALLTAT